MLSGPSRGEVDAVASWMSNGDDDAAAAMVAARLTNRHQRNCMGHNRDRQVTYPAERRIRNVVGSYTLSR